MYYKLFQLHTKLLKALANPKRLEIIQLIREQELPVTEIQDMLDLPQGNLSQHLQVLRAAGIVKTRRSGKQIYYSISHKNFIKASDLFREVLIERNKGEISDIAFKKMADLVPLASDPICGMRVSPKTSAFAFKNKGNEFYFCGSGCFEKFKNNPRKYAVFSFKGAVMR
ncbi:MAG: metalloregulator ArsR/SmtB family transcription factor [Patescibacteria group bacterium]